MSEFMILPGHGQALLDLIAIDPQPQGDPVAPVQRSYGVSGQVVQQGSFCVWRYAVLESEEQGQSVLAQIGLFDPDTDEILLTCPVTIYTLTEYFGFRRFNATANYPEAGVDLRYELWPSAIAMYFTRLEALAE